MSKEQARTFYFLLLISFPVIFTNVNASPKSYSSYISASDVNNGQNEELEVYIGEKDVGISGGTNGFIAGERGLLHSTDDTEPPRTETSPRPLPTTTTTEEPPWFNPWYKMTTGRLVMMLLISFSIPVGFMSLLFWRLRKEKKYMNARAGALVYSETVLVPSYGISNSQNPDSNGNINVNQMYTTLYDTPPEYDAVVKPKTNLEKSEKPNLEVHTTSEDIPPPAYSTVYI